MSNSNVERISARLAPEVFSYFFDKIFCRDRGAKQALTNMLYDKLHKECVRRGIPGLWDSDVQAQLMQVIDDLNFTPPKVVSPKPKKASKPVRS